MGKIEYITITDVETTGLMGPWTTDDQLIEVAALKVRLSDRAIVDQFSTLIRPHGAYQTRVVAYSEQRAWDLGAFHLSAGHFADVDPEQWAEAMTLDAALARLSSGFFQGATLAGNNVAFDVRHYQRDFALANLPWPKMDYHVIDLSSPAIYLVMAGEIEGVSLRHLAQWAGRGTQQHRALGDCLDTYAAFWAMFDFFTGGVRPVKEVP